MEMSVFTKEDPNGKHSGRLVKEQKVSLNDELYATTQESPSCNQQMDRN